MNILDQFRLHDKRVLLTGGSRGLGRSMALALASAGADLILVGRDQETLTQTADEIRSLGRTVDTLCQDMNQPEACETACEEALNNYGPIDILVNNVGGRRENIPNEEITIAKWRELMDLNLTSAVVCTKMIGSAMISRGQGGSIINIASINALVAGRNISGRHYETAKAAMVQFTRSVAADWAPKGVRINAILPGGFMTDANKRWAKIHPEVIESFIQSIPLGRFGEPAELGPLAVYLASNASSYMTGASLVIDGGYTLL